MPRVHFVKAARKQNPAVEVGESYYWWSTRITIGKRYIGRKHYSKTYPKRSQLTSSEFLQRVYAVEEALESALNNADKERDIQFLKDAIQNAVLELEDIASECRDKFDNLPENLQSGPTGETLESRADEVDVMISDLESVEFDDYDGLDVPDDGLISEDWLNWRDAKVEEVLLISYGGP